MPGDAREKATPQRIPDSSPNTYLRRQVNGYELLEELALNLQWSWSHSADRVWQRLDPVLWELTANPWVILQTVSRGKLEEVLADPDFRTLVDEQLRVRRQQSDSPAWFQKTHPKASLTGVAYFSMEFMLTEALPIYSGGLGNVAGDQLKAAADHGIPVVATGLLYQQGYFRQVIDKEGRQQALYPYNDPGQLPITPLRKEDGEWLRLEIPFPGYSLWMRAWQVTVGRLRLFLLDSNDPANLPAFRGITAQLYGGKSELRLQQEILLGIGGWRLLDVLGIRPEVCHLNEGHAAFAILERAQCFMKREKVPFAVALEATRSGNLFTTHTAVPAGFDRFSPALIDQYLSRYAKEILGIGLHELLALGRQNPEDTTECFNMAYLAIRGSGAINGVSRLHGEVSRRIFAPLFPRWPIEEVPVGYVTNGVHMPSWDSPDADDFWTRSCGKERWLDGLSRLEKSVRASADADIWSMRNAARARLVEYVRRRLARQLAIGGASMDDVERSKRLFDPEVLTLGFARRFATYKRPNMLLQDRERLLRILLSAERPVQLLIAGKAHPEDGPGQALVTDWIQFIRHSPARDRITFLSDDDMLLTERLVQGVDLWINTPRRPWEACGTSGMKVLVNGGLNLSELDGWWAEAYTPDVGWAIGDGQEHGDDPHIDHAEAAALYGLLENEIAPLYYSRDVNGIPVEWIAKIRASMAMLTAQYSASRAVRQYTEQYYLPAADQYLKRSAKGAAEAKRILEWQQALRSTWSKIRFGEVSSETSDGHHTFSAQVYLQQLDPRSVRVEIYVEAGLHQVMKQVRALSIPGLFEFVGIVSADRPIAEYTIRIIPHYEGIAVPLEASQVLWQR